MRKTGHGIRIVGVLLALALVLTPLSGLAESWAGLYGTLSSSSGVRLTALSLRESSGNGWSSPYGGNVFVLVRFHAENGTGRELTISTVVDFELRADGVSIPWSQGATLAAEPTLDGSIAPGRGAEGEVGWEVPSGWQSIELRYFPDGRSSAPLVFGFTRNDLSW